MELIENEELPDLMSILVNHGDHPVTAVGIPDEDWRAIYNFWNDFANDFYLVGIPGEDCRATYWIRCSQYQR